MHLAVYAQSSMVIIQDRKNSHLVSYVDDFLVEHTSVVSGNKNDTCKIYIKYPTTVKIWQNARRNIFLLLPYDTLHITQKSNRINYYVNADTAVTSFLNKLEFSDTLKLSFHTGYKLKKLDDSSLYFLYKYQKNRIYHQKNLLYRSNFFDKKYVDLADREITSYCILELLQAYDSEVSTSQKVPRWYTDSVIALKNKLFYNDTIIGGNEHRKLLIDWNKFLHSTSIKLNQESSFDSLYKHANTAFRGKQRSYIKAYLLFFYKNKFPNDVLNRLGDFYSSCNEEILCDFVKRVVDDSTFSYPDFAQKIILETPNSVNITWHNLLKNNEGKLILVKLTASWCAPCIGDIPFFNRLRQHYEGRKIEFISISIDKNKKQWKKILNKYEDRIFDRTAYWLGNSKRMIQFLITRDPSKEVPLWIPRYILIKKNGTIASLSTPRPDNDNSQIKKLIDTYLDL